MVAILPIIDYFLRIFERPHVMIAQRHPSQDDQFCRSLTKLGNTDDSRIRCSEAQDFTTRSDFLPRQARIR